MVTRYWPVRLYWLPFDTVEVISLGSVSSSFLMKKRSRRQGQGGCLVALDVNPQSPSGRPSPPLKTKEKFPQDNHLGCQKVSRNGRVARAACRLLQADQDMKGAPVPYPSGVTCGSLYSTIADRFPDLTPVQELSLRTAKKLVKSCKACLTEDVLEEKIEKYKTERFAQLPPLDLVHLARFKKAVAAQVRSGWNVGHYPYIPTGNATMTNSRHEAGSWNKEEFSRACGVMAIESSGKPRIVTLYSSKNSEILSPLHDALYASLQREGWLLVGSPTNERISTLSEAGPYVSVDYKQATDNIRAEYCRATIDVLKKKAKGLSAEQSAALDVVGELRFTEDGPAALRGQPMGSLMSFPMLCLINKVCVDLALADLAEAGEISWEQFRVHRCLINGDDLLYREFDSSRGILAGILRHGSLTGLVVNEEKTMVSSVYGEINSCVFKNGRKQKKTNVSVVEWRREVSDPIGFIADSVRKSSTFASVIDDWRTPIRLAWPKIQGPLPNSFWQKLRLVRAELTFRPHGQRQTRPNPFPVVTKPAGYDLTRGEEVGYIAERVARLKEECASAPRAVCGRSFFRFTKVRNPPKPVSGGEHVSIQRVLRKEITTTEDTVLKHLAESWEWKTKEKLRQVDPEKCDGVPDPTFACSGPVMSDGSLAPLGFRMVLALKDYKRNRAVRDSGRGSVDPGTAGAVSREETDFTSLVNLSVESLPIGA